MDLKSYLKGVLVLVIVEILSFTTFTLFTQPKLVVSSGILSEISRKIAHLSKHRSGNSHGSVNEVSKLSHEFSELSSKVSKLSVAVSKSLDHLSTLSGEVSKLSEDKTMNSLETSVSISQNNSSSQLYVFGGFGEKKYLSSASHYNSSTGTWEATTAMLTAKCFSCGVVIGSKVYLFGGFSPEKMYHSSAEVYDSQTGTYSQYRSLPSPRDACGAAVLNNFIYVAGGNNGSHDLSSVIRYDIRTTRQRSVSSLNYPRTGHQMVELGGYLYVIGGYKTNVEKYYPATNQWLEISYTNYAHFDFGAAVHKDKIYVCSHFGFEVYSPSMNQWKNLTPLNAYKGRTLLSMNGELWALGGNATKSVFTYDAVTEKWNQQSDMDVGRKWHTSFVVNH